MSKIIIINGSPKKEKSASNAIINTIKLLLNNEVITYSAIEMINKKSSLKKFEDDIKNADRLVVVSPLYLDALPSPMIRALNIIENICVNNCVSLKINGIINCGFYEGRQTFPALETIKVFSQRIKGIYIAGIGIGGGPLLINNRNFNRKQTKHLYAELERMFNDDLNNQVRSKNVYLSPKIPRFLYLHMLNFRWGLEMFRNRDESIYTTTDG